jgi:ABC-type polysaccharide/polyol phosphate export permease
MSIRTVAANRNLLYLLSMRELRTRYKRSLLGWAWSLLNPLVQLAIFSVIFLHVFKQKPPVGDPSGLRSFPIYFLCGFVPFNFFSVSVGVSIGAIQGGSSLIKKVVFPHENLVLSVIIAQFVTVLIELAVVTVALLIAGNMVLLRLPVMLVVLVLLAVFTTGVALLLASVNAFFNDVSYLWTIASQLLFYATPVIWNPDEVGLPALTQVASWGPTGAFIMAMHEVLYDLRTPSAMRFTQLVVYAAASFAIGSWVFNRLSPRFAEEL